MYKGSYKSNDYLTMISMISFWFMAGISIWEKSGNKAGSSLPYGRELFYNSGN